MIEILQYMTSGFWKFIGCFLILLISFHYIVNGILRIFGRIFRCIMVLSRGWPPEHLDADGDYIIVEPQHEER